MVDADDSWPATIIARNTSTKKRYADAELLIDYPRSKCAQRLIKMVLGLRRRLGGSERARFIATKLWGSPQDGIAT